MKNKFEIKELQSVEEMLPLLSVLRQLSPHVKAAGYKRMLKEMTGNGYRMVAVYEGKKCIGMSGFWINTKLYCDRYIEPDNVVIDKNYRSKGVGKLLLDWLEAEGRRKGCKTVILDSYVENAASHKFYFREGYFIRGFHFLKKL